MEIQGTPSPGYISSQMCQMQISSSSSATFHARFEYSGLHDLAALLQKSVDQSEPRRPKQPHLKPVDLGVGRGSLAWDLCGQPYGRALPQLFSRARVCRPECVAQVVAQIPTQQMPDRQI